MFATPTRLPALAATFVTPAVFAAGKPDIQKGKTILAQRCGTCHAVNNEPGGPVTGPNMAGVIAHLASLNQGFGPARLNS